MALSISVNTGSFDASGSPISATYWKLVQVSANSINQTFSGVYNGYASSTSFASNPNQIPLMQYQINFPDITNTPGVTWPFSSAALATNYPGNPMAFLIAAEAYAMNYPFFSGATEVS